MHIILSHGFPSITTRYTVEFLIIILSQCGRKMFYFFFSCELLHITSHTYGFLLWNAFIFGFFIPRFSVLAYFITFLVSDSELHCKRFFVFFSNSAFHRVLPLNVFKAIHYIWMVEVLYNVERVRHERFFYFNTFYKLSFSKSFKRMNTIVVDSNAMW